MNDKLRLTTDYVISLQYYLIAFNIFFDNLLIYIVIFDESGELQNDTYNRHRQSERRRGENNDVCKSRYRSGAGWETGFVGRRGPARFADTEPRFCLPRQTARHTCSRHG